MLQEQNMKSYRGKSLRIKENPQMGVFGYFEPFIAQNETRKAVPLNLLLSCLFLLKAPGTKLHL